MFSRSIRRAGVAGAMTAAVSLALAVGAQAKQPQALTVCKHGCRYSTIQSAVNASGKNATIKRHARQVRRGRDHQRPQA